MVTNRCCVSHVPARVHYRQVYVLHILNPMSTFGTEQIGDCRNLGRDETFLINVPHLMKLTMSSNFSVLQAIKSWTVGLRNTKWLSSHSF